MKKRLIIYLKNNQEYIKEYELNKMSYSELSYLKDNIQILRYIQNK